MDRPRRRRLGAVLAAGTAAGALTLSTGVLAAASADPSPQGTTHRQKAHHRADDQAHHGTAGQHAHGKSGQHSSVSLPRPNHFQAQADPDGTLNGGVDQPGGQGGLDPTSQDGNNGSGNDADCEDDNNGVGVPGHCRDEPTEPGPVVPEAAQLPGIDAGTTLADSSTVSAPLASPPAGGASSVVVSRGTSTPSVVLPETGAAQGMAALAAAGVVAVALGSTLVRRRRSTP